MAETIDWPPARRPRRRGRLFLVAVVAVLLVSAITALSYYVDALWFDSLGYSSVFWKTLNLQAVAFSGFTLVTFALLYGSFLALKPAKLGELAGLPILINGQPIKLPVEPVIRLIAIAGSAVIAFATGAGMMAEWPALALYWYAPPAAGAVDPIFGRPLPFYLFTLPVWQMRLQSARLPKTKPLLKRRVNRLAKPTLRSHRRPTLKCMLVPMPTAIRLPVQLPTYKQPVQQV